MIRTRCCAADPVGSPGSICQQSFAKGGKGALELARQRRQIVDHQRELQNSTVGTREFKYPDTKLLLKVENKKK